MAFDPSKTLYSFAETPCSVQIWLAESQVAEFPSLPDAVAYAKQQGGKWNDVEITVHMPREDIVYGTDKTRSMIDAYERAAKQSATKDPQA